MAANDTVLAIDIGGSKIVCAIVSAEGQILQKEQAALRSVLGFDHVWEVLRRCAAALEPVLIREVSAAGTAIPGLADAESGIWLYSPFSNIQNIGIAELLTREYGIPAFIENDVNACALAEIRFGVCREIRDFLWITVSNGIGGGVAANGTILRGCDGNSGEIGHIIVEYDPAEALRCGCGKLGCAEAMAAGPGIQKRYARELERKGIPAGSLCGGIGEVERTAQEIAGFAREGDQTAQSVYRKTGEYIGTALAAAANILNPRAAVFGGGISLSFDLWEAGIRQGLEHCLFEQGNRNLRILRTGLGYDAALLGAAAVAVEGRERMCVAE